MTTIGIIGGGVAGVVSAWLLSRKYDVTLIEKNHYVGGHTNTVLLKDGPDSGTPIDTGFIVLNDRTYPLLTKFLAELNVRVRHSDMSFSVHSEDDGLEYASNSLNALFAQRRNLFSSSFLGMLLDLRRFWSIGQKAIREHEPGSLREFLEKNKFGKSFQENFIYPLGAAVWSSSKKDLDSFPAFTFLSFFHNHGWLTYSDQPRWQTVVGGSYQYVESFLHGFGGTVLTKCPAVKVRQGASGQQEVVLNDGERLKFDILVLCCHADEALALLDDAHEVERNFLSPWQYCENRTLLHTDASFMPVNQRAWASWNYRKEIGANDERSVAVTYYMNRLQGLQTKENYFVTLNPLVDPREGSVVREFLYTHPVYSKDSVKAQGLLAAQNGIAGRWFCGSYAGYGFHEDAVRSAVRVANKLGISWY